MQRDHSPETAPPFGSRDEFIDRIITYQTSGPPKTRGLTVLGVGSILTPLLTLPLLVFLLPRGIPHWLLLAGLTVVTMAPVTAGVAILHARRVAYRRQLGLTCPRCDAPLIGVYKDSSSHARDVAFTKGICSRCATVLFPVSTATTTVGDDGAGDDPGGRPPIQPLR